MAAWHQSWVADLGLRAAGAVVAAAAWLAVARLAEMGGEAGATADALAAAGFLGGSAGSAMILMGRHLFDRIAVSSQWRHRPVRDPRDQMSSTRRP